MFINNVIVIIGFSYASLIKIGYFILLCFSNLNQMKILLFFEKKPHTFDSNLYSLLSQ